MHNNNNKSVRPSSPPFLLSLLLLLLLPFFSSLWRANASSVLLDEHQQLVNHPAKAPLRRESHLNSEPPSSASQRSSRSWTPLFVPKGLTYNKVLNENKKGVAKGTNKKNYPGEVLGYITPWNSEGFDVALRFQSKFTFLSPVWFQIKRQTQVKNGFTIEGKEGINREWIERLRRTESTTTTTQEKKVKLVPRFLMESWSPEDYLSFFSLATLSSALSTTLSYFVSENGFDGMVFDMGYTGFRDPRSGRNSNNDNEDLIKFFRELGSRLHTEGKTLIVVVPPGSGFQTKDLISLDKYVDRFSLMAYDFSTQQPGPNAPFPWFHSILSTLLGEHGHSVDEVGDDGDEEDEEEEEEGIQQHPLAHKILIGLNFYGYDFASAGYNKPPSVNALLGRDFLSLLEKYKPKEIRWDDTVKEHSLVYIEDEENLDPRSNKIDTRPKHIVYYPSIRSLQVRLFDSYLFGTGISIWEIGQGLDSFYSQL